MRRFSFNYPCDVAVVYPDGTLSTMRFDMDDVVEYVGPSVHMLEVRYDYTFELPDGLLLRNVPREAINWEFEDAGCV